MRIEIERRNGIIARAANPFPVHTALISITDSDRDYAELKKMPDFIIREYATFISHTPLHVEVG